MSDPSPNIHYCPRCGASLADQMDTCPSCGQSLCPACGAQVDANAMRCPGCGAIFEAACPECGAAVKPEDVSCAQCGAKFQPAVAPITPDATAIAPALTQAEQLQQAYFSAMNQLKSKTPPDRVEAQLIASGVTAPTSHALVGTLQATRRQADWAAGKRAMMLGGLWTVGGLAITLLGQSQANERGGSYLILWGAVIIGALQFLGGLRQFTANAPARVGFSAQPEIDPVMAASGYVWPMPQQNKWAWVGVVVFLGLMAVLSFSSLGPPLINVPAAQANLTAADLGSGFSVIDERGSEIFQDNDLRDANQRTLQDEKSLVQATVLVWKQRVGDSPTEVLAGFDKPIRQNTATPAKFVEPHTVTVGQHSGALESFQFESLGRQGQGYVLAFVQDNVIVIVFEVGQSGAVSEEQVVGHAQLIDQRFK